MNAYFCHKCATKRGILSGDIEVFNPTGNTYQIGKYFKHYTKPNGASLISVFDKSGNEKYKDYIINTLASGCVEQNIFGRINVVWVADKKTGYMYKDGHLQGEADAVKVVLHSDSQKIHAFPTGSANLSNKKCPMSWAAPWLTFFDNYNLLITANE